MFSVGHCPNEGRGGPCPNLKKHNIHFWRSKKMYKFARKRGRGGRGNSGNARKKTFILIRGLPLPRDILSLVASLFSQKETQEITTRRIHGPYTWNLWWQWPRQRKKVCNIGDDSVDFPNLYHKIPHVALEVKADQQGWVRAWEIKSHRHRHHFRAFDPRILNH